MKGRVTNHHSYYRRDLIKISPIKSLKCPLCKGKLVGKTGKFGAFWGCSR